MHHFPVAAGDSILVHSGQVHAIDAGNLILEIQQNSDTTYRVYDWGRAGRDGRPRQLHIAESLRSIQWDEFEPAPVRAAPTPGVIADCDEFRIRRVVLGAGERLDLAAGEQPRLLSVVSGCVVPPGPGDGPAGGAAALVRLGRERPPALRGRLHLCGGRDHGDLVLLTENFVREIPRPWGQL